MKQKRRDRVNHAFQIAVPYSLAASVLAGPRHPWLLWFIYGLIGFLARLAGALKLIQGFLQIADTFFQFGYRLHLAPYRIHNVSPGGLNICRIDVARLA